MQGKTMARACPGPLGAHPGAAAADVKQGRGLFLGVARAFALRRGNQRIGIAVTNLKFLDLEGDSDVMLFLHDRQRGGESASGVD
jgi:hypothetical protein